MASKQIANQYILAFARDAEGLLTTWASFNNFLIFLQSRYFNFEAMRELNARSGDKKELEKAQVQILQQQENAQEKQDLINLTSNLRTWVTLTHTRFNALKKRYSEFKAREKVVDETYEKICNPEKASFVPLHSDIKKYCEAMHDLLNENIIADALSDAQAMYSNISQAYQEAGQ